MEFTEKIQKVIDEKRITIKDMCKDLDLSVQTYYNWKKGTQVPLDKAISIIKYLNISADQLFDIHIDENTDTEKALEELRYMRKVFNFILDSDDIKEIHELALGGIDYATKEHKKILGIE